MRTLIIGLCGRAGSGKTSVAAHLEQHYGARRISFAYPLKLMTMDIWGFSEGQVFGEAEIKEIPDQRTGVPPRWAMQRLGQAARDHLGQDVWLRRALDQVGEGLNVIEDVRHCNEAAAIAALDGGHVIRLHCKDFEAPGHSSVHASETEVDMIPRSNVWSEVHSSRAQGLVHLLGCVDYLMKGLLDE